MSLTAPSATRPTLLPRVVAVAARAVPVLVAVQFAMMAVVPVAVVLVGAFADSHLRAFRPWAVGLALTFSVPLLLRAFGPDPSLSLSRTMDPVLTTVVIVVAVVVAIAFHVVRRRGSA